MKPNFMNKNKTFSLFKLSFLISLILICLSSFSMALPQDSPNSKEEKENNVKTKQNNNEKEANIYLNLQDTSLKEVVNYLAEQKKINLIPDKGLDAIKVTMSTRTPLTLEDAWNVLLTLLEANNFSIVNVDDIHRIVPIAVSKQHPLPAYINVDSETLPDNNQKIRYVYLFKNIKNIDEIKPILDQTLSPNSVLYNPSLKGCLITEKSLNIKSTMRIIKMLDTGGLKEDMKILQLKEATAEDVAKLFTEGVLGATQAKAPPLPGMLPQQQVAYFAKTTKVIPEPRTNRLILLGTETELKKLIDFIEKFVDKPIEGLQSRLHIKELKYADAEKIKPILDAIIKPPAKDAKTPLVGQVKYFEDMVIAAEAVPEGEGTKSINVGSGNRLIIACTKEDWKRIEPFIDKLDKPKPQVAIEVLFVDAKLDTEKQLGSQLRNKKTGMLGNHIDFETQHITSLPTTAAGQNIMHGRNLMSVIGDLETKASFITLGKAGSIWAVAKSVLRTENLNVLSQPYLVTSNNKESTLFVSTKRTIPGAIDSSSVTAVKKFRDVEAKIETTLTPNINLEGMISLKIEIKIDEFKEGGEEQNRTNRHINTKTTMADGEVLVIGGLVQDKLIDTAYKTSLLSSIPLLGNLFKNKARTLEKKNLFVFIRPIIIKPKFEGKPDEYTQLKLDYAKRQVQKHDGLNDPKDPIQRWFFHPTKEGVKTLADIKAEDVKPIIEFTEGKDQPKSVIIPIDPYYKTRESRTIRRLEEKKIKARKERRHRNPSIEQQKVKIPTNSPLS